MVGFRELNPTVCAEPELALPKLLDLKEVIQVVSGFHDDELADGLTATFVMDAIRGRLHRGWRASQEREIGRP